MFPVLRVILVHLWVTCVTGAVLVAGLAMGFVGLATFVWATVLGLLVGVPAGLLNWVYLRPNRAWEIGWNWLIVDLVRAFGYRRPGVRRPVPVWQGGSDLAKRDFRRQD